ncbi:Short-chain dehydrogenase/reductase family protein [Mycena venus]|uniref:Short-chain dehydrogenase/reductase family protein n=1 Tax=Mycena venus TaxID=2733690 RepID=A0A8H6Z1W5_9AGAR|nr:Short-chain dehydrogenase/reductase family protein [Mycena venus]
MSTFTPTTTGEEVATAFAQEIKGKNVLITGTSVNGLGFEAARIIAKYANLVIITGHNAERLKLSEDALKKDIPGANIRTLLLNLASLDAVRKAAEEVNAYPEQIDILINNAASSICRFRLTTDGFEQQIATDHLGPFLFTALILLKILAAQTVSYTPRVVFVASGAHAWSEGVKLDEIEHPNESTYNGMQAYSQSKSANILTARELTRRAGGRIHSYSLSPGGGYRPSAITLSLNTISSCSDKLCSERRGAASIIAAWRHHGGRKAQPERSFSLEDASLRGPPQLLQPHLTHLSTVRATLFTCIFSDNICIYVTDKPGCYLNHSVENNEGVAPHSSDPVRAEKLWELSERLVGVKFL